ncbi:MAG: hypothetical protein H6701_08745 [Myxococcales bacterium]|nr:hypothetical protein [Myxococcales bacterium]
MPQDLPPLAPWLIAAAAVIGLALGLALAGRARERRRRRAAAHGRRMEARAPAALARRGYRVIERHPALTVVWHVDGEPRELTLEADLLVARGGRRYVVEVKTGGAAQVERRDTRRQLLEYAVHYRADGVLLYDADDDTLRAVDFPLPRPARRLLWFALGLLAGVALAALLAAGRVAGWIGR